MAPLATLACALTSALLLGLATAAEPRHHARHCAADMRFTSEQGLFVQESKAAELPAAGQHESFGARVPWPAILARLDGAPGRKLLLLVRHGEATSNAVQRAVGNEEWEGRVAKACAWRNSGQTLELFDPALTAAGQQQAGALLRLLQHGPVDLRTLTGGRQASVVVSPMRRTLETFQAALGPLVRPSQVAVDEFCRERLGSNTCDARHPAQLSPDSKSPAAAGAGTCNGSAEAESCAAHSIACPVSWALADAFPDIAFPVTGLSGRLGLVSNRDSWWRADERESDAAMADRAAAFLERLFANTPEPVVLVVTHSGMIGALLSAIGRQPYSAANAELVPALVTASPAA